MNRRTTAPLTCIAMLALLVPGAWAQDTVAAPGGSTSSIPSDIDATTDVAQAAVTLDGEVLFRVRGVTAYPAEQRAQTINGRIKAIAADRSVSTDTLRVVEAGDRSNLLAGDRHVMSVVDADAKLEGVSRQQLAELIRRKVAEAIASYREDRSARVLLVNTVYALGATLAAVLLLFACQRAFRRLDAVAERRFKSRIEVVELRSRQLIQAQQLQVILHGLVKMLRVLSVLVIVYVYLDLVLGLYPWTRPLAQRLFLIVLDPLRTMGAGFLDTLPNLVFIALLIIVSRYVLKAARLFFAGVDQGTITVAGFVPEWAWPTYKIVRLCVIVFAIVVAYPHIPGSESEAFKGVSIFLGVIFSLGSSSFIANMIAGYTMIYRRAYKVGDRIQVNDISGDVVEMRLMVTHLRTIKNEEIVVPNSLILNSHVINYSTLAQSRGLILHTTVGIGYETSWRQVEAMLRLAAERTPGLLKEPPPFVLQKSLGDFAVTYELNVYCDNPQGMARFYTALHQNILDVFNEYGVQIMTPAYEGDPDAPKVVPRDRWFAAPAAGSTPLSGEQ
jgi:small-conductance mechanosensitive channel